MATITLMQTGTGFQAPRLTGTLTSNGTTAVVGVGTEFVAELVGYSFRFVGGTVDYTIASVTDAAHLTTTTAVPTGSGQVAFLSSEQGLLEANFHLLGSAAKANATAFQAANASTTLLGNNTTGTGSTLVLADSPTLVTPHIGSATAIGLDITSIHTQERLFYDANNYTTLTVGSSGMLTITPSGGSATITGSVGVGLENFTPAHQLHIRGTGGGSAPNTSSRVLLESFSTTTTFMGAPYLVFQKSHSSTVGTYTPTVNGEDIGVLQWNLIDAAGDLQGAGVIAVYQMGAAGTGWGRTAAYMQFYIPNGSGDAPAILALYPTGPAGYYTTSVPAFTVDGQFSPAYVSSTNRWYWRSNGGVHYVNATAGFEIPSDADDPRTGGRRDETIDPISGEQMGVDDLVVGIVDRSFPNDDPSKPDCLHGVYTRFSSGLKKSGGVSGSFTSGGKSITVTNGLITAIE